MDVAATAARLKSAWTMPTPALQRATFWPATTSTGDPLNGLLQRSVAGRAIPTGRAIPASPEHARSLTGLEEQEGPIGHSWASGLPQTRDTVPTCGHGCGCASCSAPPRATSAAPVLARAGTAVAGPCADVEQRPHPALLLKGSTHSAVREAQRKLNLHKTGDTNAPLVPDCMFGPLTDAAVREFQKQQFGGDPKQVDGKIGPKTWEKLDAVVAPGPVPPVPPVPPPAPITIASATVKAAPSGAANTRKEVGVGEVVDFTASAAGIWKATNGTPTTGASSTTFRWKAPAVADTVTIALTSGTQTATDTIKVIAPNAITMRKVSSHTGDIGVGGACMLNEVKFGPDTVNLGATQWLEVPGPATGVDGFFKKFSAATLHHNPTLFYISINDSNILDGSDHCAWHTTPGPYKDGSFTWVVPNRYKLDGEPDSKGRFFTNTSQVFTMNSAGTMHITKAGAST